MKNMKMTLFFLLALFPIILPLPVHAQYETFCYYYNNQLLISLNRPAYEGINDNRSEDVKLDYVTRYIYLANPFAAKDFLNNQKLLDMDSARTGSTLKPQAMALQDLYTLMNRDWNPGQFNELNKSLINRIGKDKPLHSSGLVSPDTVIIWLKTYLSTRYGDYNSEKMLTVKKAVRDWTTVFGSVKTIRFAWSNPNPKYGDYVTIQAREWTEKSLLERNAIIKAFHRYNIYLVENGNNSLAEYCENEDEKHFSFEEMDQKWEHGVRTGKRSAMMTSGQGQQLASMDHNADNSSLLNNYFDGTVSRSEHELKMWDANRDSDNRELFSRDNRELAASMLKTSILKELKGTTAGNRLKDNFRIEIAYCDKGYSELKPDGTIVLDEEIIQQYMRLRGFTAASVIKDALQMQELAKYMSPIVVYESARREQDVWAKANNKYKPRTQEDEIDARSLEALYFNEKSRTNSRFTDIFVNAENYSKYAAKRMENAASYTQGRKMFADNVRMECSNLPTISSSTSGLLAGVNKELERRKALSAGERENEFSFITYAEVCYMTPDEIMSSLRDIQEGALVMLADSLNSGAYEEYNRNAISATRNNFNNIGKTKANESNAGMHSSRVIKEIPPMP